MEEKKQGLINREKPRRRSVVTRTLEQEEKEGRKQDGNLLGRKNRKTAGTQLPKRDGGKREGGGLGHAYKEPKDPENEKKKKIPYQKIAIGRRRRSRKGKGGTQRESPV